MVISQVIIAITILKEQIVQNENEYKEYCKQYNKAQRDMIECGNKKKDLLKLIKELEDKIVAENIFINVSCVEGFGILTQPELVAISTGIDKTDYREYGDYPRWIDLERIVKDVINIKKKYPLWKLESVKKSGQYDTMPPQNFYKYTYETEEGNYFTCGGVEIINS